MILCTFQFTPPGLIMTTEKVKLQQSMPPSLREEIVTNSCHVDSLVVDERDRGLKCFLGRVLHINTTTTIVPQASIRAFLENINASRARMF